MRVVASRSAAANSSASSTCILPSDPTHKSSSRSRQATTPAEIAAGSATLQYQPFNSPLDEWISKMLYQRSVKNHSIKQSPVSKVVYPNSNGGRVQRASSRTPLG